MAAVTTPLTVNLRSKILAPTLNGESTTTSERPAFLKKFFKKVGRGIKKGFKKIGNGIKTVAKKFARGVKTVVSKIGKGIKNLGRKIGKKVKEFLGKFGGFVSKIWKKISKAVKKVASTVWNGVKWVSRKLWYGLKGIYYRVKQWTNYLPSRLRRLVNNLWAGVKSLKPWSVSWWKSLGKAKTWKDFLSWLGKNLIYVAEVVGVGELYETVAEVVKFNTRPLNSREIALAKSVFGNTINYNLVRVDTNAIFGPSWNGRPYVSFNTINSWGPLEDDVFIHEMTHVWQYQQDGAIYMAEAIHAQNSKEKYNYGGLAALQARKGDGLTGFNREQQGAILQDYYRLLEYVKTGTGNKPQYAPYATCSHLPLYAHFVKDASTLTEAQLVGPGCSPILTSNLSGKSFNVLQEPRNAGQSFTTQFQIQNTQGLDSGSFDVDFYLSNNKTISILDRHLGKYNISNLAGNSSTSTLSQTLTLPAKGDSFWNSVGDGTYYIGMIVDGSNSVVEASEADNSNTGEFKDYDGVVINNTIGATISVKINRVKGDFDHFLFRSSDFYSRISIGNSTWRTPTKGNDNDYSPSDWVYSRYVNGTTVPITIQLWDSDSFGSDDHVDIDPKVGYKDVNITYDLRNGQVYGDLRGYKGWNLYSRGESGKGQIWFTVNQS